MMIYYDEEEALAPKPQAYVSLCPSRRRSISAAEAWVGLYFIRHVTKRYIQMIQIKHKITGNKGREQRDIGDNEHGSTCHLSPA